MKMRRVPLVLSAEEDADIIEWLEGLRSGQRSEAIRQILREHLEGRTSNEPVSEAELRNILREELARRNATGEGTGDEEEAV